MTRPKRIEFDESQTEAFEGAARRLAEFVAQTGRSARVLGVSPPERKVMHTALNDAEQVDNTSEGFGLFRHVKLEPKKEEEAVAEPEAPSED